MNKIKWIIITLVVVMLGGCQMSQTETMSKEELRSEQNRMVEFVATHYEDIQKVEFTEMEENKMTGSYSFEAIINEDIKVRFTLKGIGGEMYINTLVSKNNGAKLSKKSEALESINIEKIEIVYLVE